MFDLKKVETNSWLVVEPPIWKMMEFGPVGMMTFPTEWKNHPNVPNHQPAIKSHKTTILVG